MKRILINLYYNFLMFLEDILGGVETLINNHRKRIDVKYWCKYIAPQSSQSFKSDNKKDTAV